MADIVTPSTAFAFVIEMSEKHKFTSPSVIQVKNRWKTISTEEKLDISHLEKREQIVHICCKVQKKEIVSVSRNVRFTQSSVHIICENAERITGSAMLGTKVFV